MHPRAVADVISRTILPSRNKTSGFWAASIRNGFDAEAVWAAASDAYAAVFDLHPAEVRDLLDGEVGGLFADDIGFIEDGVFDAEAIEGLIRARLHHLGWQRLYEQAIDAIRAGRSKRT